MKKTKTKAARSAKRRSGDPQVPWLLAGGASLKADDTEPLSVIRPKIEVVRPSPRTRYYLYLKGFRDGAAGTFSSDEGSEDYTRGYEDGSASLSRASDLFAVEAGYAPKVLRVQDM